MEIDNRKMLVTFSKRLIHLANKSSIELRLFGSLAVDIICDYNLSNSKKISDIDLIGQMNNISNTLSFFNKIGFIAIEEPIFSKNGWHYILKSKDNIYSKVIHVDLYFGKLTFNHNIPLPYFTQEYKYTLPVTQLLISKLAIVHLTSKDIKAILKLLYFNEISNNNSLKSIKLNYVVKIWADGWHGWEISNTCITNLFKIKKLIKKCNNDFVSNINSKIDVLLIVNRRINKKCCWKTRKLIGDNIPTCKQAN